MFQHHTWVRVSLPFQDRPKDFKKTKCEKLINMLSVAISQKLPREIPLTVFGNNIKEEYSKLSTKATKIFLAPPATYLSEVGSSPYSLTKASHCNTDVEADTKMLFSIKPDVQEICKL